MVRDVQCIVTISVNGHTHIHIYISTSTDIENLTVKACLPYFYIILNLKVII